MTVRATECEAIQSEIAEQVLAQVAQAIPPGVAGELTLDTSLYDLGLDSLAVMDVFNRIEESFGMRFREEWLYDMQTCRDVIDCVAAHSTKGPAAEAPKRPAKANLRETVANIASADDTIAETLDEPIPPEHYDVDQFPECVAFHQRLALAAAAGFENPFFRSSESVRPSVAVIGGCETINYTSFDYLGMAGHPAVVAAAQEAIARFGTSASASRLVGGNNAIVEELDAEIASFLGTEAAAVFPAGYGTNASLFGHLFGEGDLILYDELAHNSIQQGAALSKAGRRSFPHNDYRALDKLLRELRGGYRRVVVAMEGVYSMDGDYPDLPRFLEVKQRHRALLYVDEAHSVGVMGPNGRGICEHFGVDPSEGDLWMGTISKALASGGGYIAGREKLIRYLKYTTPSFVFSTGCSPANAAASLAAIRQIRLEPQRVSQLHDRASLFLKLAQDCGLDTGKSGDTPVIPIILGDSMLCVWVSRELLRRGVNAQPILYPAVREKEARIRFFITSEHTEDQIVRTVEALAETIELGRANR